MNNIIRMMEFGIWSSILLLIIPNMTGFRWVALQYIYGSCGLFVEVISISAKQFFNLLPSLPFQDDHKQHNMPTKIIHDM